MKLNWNLAFLFMVMVLLIVALFYGEHHFPMDGQIFQVIAGLLTAAGATFFSAARHTFNIPDEKPSEAIQPPKNEPATIPHKEE